MSDAPPCLLCSAPRQRAHAYCPEHLDMVMDAIEKETRPRPRGTFDGEDGNVKDRS